MKNFTARLGDVLINGVQLYAELVCAYFILLSLAAAAFYLGGQWAGVPFTVAIPCVTLWSYFRTGQRYVEMRALPSGKNWLLPLALLAVLVLPPDIAISAAHSVGRTRGSRARQSEAKIALAAVFGAEKSYYRHHNTYAPSFREIAYTPEGQRRFYAIGFSPKCQGQSGFDGALIDTSYSSFETPQSRLAAETFFRERTICKDPRLGFEVYAIGVIGPGGALDVWKIDENKKLENVENGR